jgi:F-type H+-transporting ATPase subunit gamma
LKGSEYFRRRGKNVVYKCAGASEATAFEDAESLGDRAASMYKSGEVDEVYLIYTHFESILTHSPHIEKLLPIRTETQESTGSGPVEMSYDPDIGTFISYAVPMYLNVTIYGAMMESAVCEYASRMTSMDSATRNATDIIEDLTLDYNRKRQGLITQEITEIVSGANALK